MLDDPDFDPDRTRPLGHALWYVLYRLEDRHSSAQRIDGLTTGHRELDAILHGLQRQSLVVVAGPAECGKSALALSIATHIGTKNQLPVLYFTLEESDLDITERLLLLESGMDRERFWSGHFQRDDWRKLDIAVKRMKDSKIFIDDTPCQTAAAIARVANWVKDQHGLALIVVDRLELVSGSGDTWQEARPRVTRDLKELATQVDSPIIALSRLANDFESRGEFPPGPFDTRDCDAIQDADVILSMGPHRPNAPIPDGNAGTIRALPRSVSITCLKNDDGRTGTIKVGRIALGMPGAHP